MKYIERAMEKQVLDASGYFPIVAVCGLRQSGKSTMLEHIREKGRTVVSLDDDTARNMAETDPELFLETYRAPLVIDEFQRAPSLSVRLKYVVDKRLLAGDESVYGAYWLTGSQKFEMMKGLTESMVGRCCVLDMSGLSTAEIDGRDPGPFFPDAETMRKRADEAPKRSLYEVYERIFEGGMPAYVSGHVPREKYFDSFKRLYITRDVGEMLKVTDPNAFENFVSCLAARTGQELNCDKLGDTIGVSSPTVKAWVSVLEASGIVYLLRPYYNNAIKRLVKRPKVYFTDTGLCSYLTRYHTAEELCIGPMDGAMLETYVVSEIVKSYQGAGKQPDLYYYRDAEGREIDLLMKDGNDVYPIEIKKATYPRDAAKNVYVLENTGLNVMPCTIACLADRFMPCDRQSFYFPIYAL